MENELTANITNTQTADNELHSAKWDYEEALANRKRYLSPVLATFQSYEMPLLLQRGQGQYLWDSAGRRYLDCIAQNLCISVGYNHPVVTAQMYRQMQELQHCTTMWMHPGPGLLAKEIVNKLPSDGDWVVHFVNSGSEAIDLATMLARLYTGNTEILALRHSYHGLQFSAMAATGIAGCHQPIAAAPGFIHVSNPDQYRGIYGSGVDDYLAELKATISSSTSGPVAGMLFEPIQGYGGVIPLRPDYVEQAAKIVRASGGVMIADEVQAGIARTGEHFWGFEQYGFTPDIVVMAKGLGNGFPIAAVATHREIAETMAHRKFFNTYGANPVGSAAGRAVLATIESEGLQENAASIGQQMKEMLEGLKTEHEIIGDVRGRGLLQGIEIVSNRERKIPAANAAARLAEELRERGVIVGRSGADGNVLRVAPPLCISSQDVELFHDAFEPALKAAGKENWGE